jgi:AraC-like DNA-binding protein
MNRITPPPVHELQRMYAGCSLDEMSGLLRVSVATVRTWVHDAGIEVRPKGGIPGRFKVAEVKTGDLVRAFREQEHPNYTLLAHTFGITRATVMYRLKQAIPSELPHRKHRLELPTDVICKLYQDDHIPLEDIAEQFHVSVNALRRRLVAMGISIRSKTHHLKAWHAQRKQKLAEAEDKVTDLEKRLEEAKQERDRLQLENEGQAAVVRAMLDEATPRFARLFSLPEIKKDARLLLDGGWSHPDFSEADVKAAAATILGRAPIRKRARIAARYLISFETHLELETVRRYDR